MTEVLNPGSRAPQWYTVQTRYRFERKVSCQLERQGLEIFLPLLKEIHHWSDRRKRVDVLLFPGYTFVRFDSSPTLRKIIQNAPGVIGFIPCRGEVVPVPAKQIDDLRTVLSQDLPCALHPFLKVGQRVRIRSGSLDGLEGILAQAGPKKLVISIDSIQRAVAVTIEGYELQLI